MAKKPSAALKRVMGKVPGGIKAGSQNGSAYKHSLSGLQKESVPDLENDHDQKPKPMVLENEKEALPFSEFDGAQNQNVVVLTLEKQSLSDLENEHDQTLVLPSDSEKESLPKTEIDHAQKQDSVMLTSQKESLPVLEIGGAQISKPMVLSSEKESPPKTVNDQSEHDGHDGSAQISKRITTKNEKESLPKTELKKTKKPKPRGRQIGQLKGEQLKFLVGVTKLIKNRDTLETPKTTLAEVAAAAGVDKDTTKTSYRRCKERGFVESFDVEAGAVGGLRLRMPSDVFWAVVLKNEKESLSENGSYARAVVVADLRENEKPVAASDQSEGGTPPSVGRSGATAERKPTTPTTTDSPKSNRAEDWRRSDYLWAYAVVIPPIMESRGFRQSHMLEFERNDFDPKEVQRSVEDFAKALELGYEKKRKWKSPIAVFLEAMRDKGYYSIDTVVTEEEREQQNKDAHLDDLPFG